MSKDDISRFLGRFSFTFDLCRTNIDAISSRSKEAKSILHDEIWPSFVRLRGLSKLGNEPELINQLKRFKIIAIKNMARVFISYYKTSKKPACETVIKAIKTKISRWSKEPTTEDRLDVIRATFNGIQAC
eukprot:TRINITY_DN24931_c0_g1_i1.p1 TRINITY_DN24931_c0_g1~~TRINITY_DN24931_c0_g1_i1.p1  ORF type:complete len:130 (-),score=12.84 TRINITY_DN24931_c0_g1_i1:59-448(-)